MNLQDTHEEVADALARLSRLFQPQCKLSFVMRNPHVEDGDMFVSDDDPEKVIEAIRKVAGRPERRLT